MIHTFRHKDEYIVLDIASGSIHRIDEISFDILSCFDSFFTKEELMSAYLNKYDKKQLDELYYEIKQLYDEGMLYSEDDFEVLFNEKGYTNKGLKALCLNVAHDCNMICDYCFAQTGGYSGHRCLMTADTAKKALKLLIEGSGSRKNIEVDFFGGEPLLNFKVIKETVEYGRELEKEYGKKINYTITTNGTILNDEIKEFINSEMDNIVISVDGRPQIHDRVRKTAVKNGTHQKVLENAKNILKDRTKDKSHYIRGTFTRYNLDFSKDVEYLNEQGFSVISIEPVTGKGRELDIKDDDVERIKEEYDTLTDIIEEKRKEGKELEFYHFNAKIYGGPCIYKRIAACGAGCDYIAVAADGKIYPCHQFVGEPDFEVGDVTNGIIRDDIRDAFADCNIFSKEGCQRCFAKYFCSGGCHANSYHINGDIKKPDGIFCELQKKRIECAIYLEVIKEG